MSEEIKDKTVGILAYVTLIGFIIAIIMNNDKTGEEKKFGAFHLRQSLGLIIAGIGLYIVNAIISAIFLAIGSFFGILVGLITTVLSLVFIAFIIIGIINAANGEKKELPFIGRYISDLLKNTFE